MPEAVTPSLWTRYRRTAAVALAVAVTAPPILVLSVVVRQARSAEAAERPRADERSLQLTAVETRVANASADEVHVPAGTVHLGSIPIPLAPYDSASDRPSAPPERPVAAVDRQGVIRRQGVVTAVRKINGIYFASISVGSSQGMQKGMQARVTANGDFVDILSIVNVEFNEAIGYVSGADPARVRPGMSVPSCSGPSVPSW
jgi:hypothetical protein